MGVYPKPSSRRDQRQKSPGKKRGEDDYFSRAICLWSRVAGRLAQISLIENGASSSRLNKEANPLKSDSFLMMYRPVDTKSRYNAFSILSVSYIGVTHTPKTRTDRYPRRIGANCADLHSLAELPEGNFACKIQVYFVRSYKMRILPFREETKNRTRPRIRTIQIKT